MTIAHAHSKQASLPQRRSAVEPAFSSTEKMRYRRRAEDVMNQGTLRAVVVGLSLVGMPALAADKPSAPPPPPKPAAQLDQLKLFLGNWKCSGKQFATPMFGPDHAFTGSASARMEADGFWQQWVYEEKKAKDHPGIRLVGLWGWDSGGKRFIRAAGSSLGGWDSATSVGFNGDKMVWTGDLSSPAGRMPFRQTFTKKSDKEWSFRLELNTQGAWVPLSEVTCTASKK
jgi:hypothetical protein